MSFVAMEGIDGAGSETQTSLLKEFLERMNIPFLFVKSPDLDHPVGKLYDDYLHEKFDLNTEQVFLLCAIDVLNSVSRIEKGLEEGKVVIADRYITSTLAYRDAKGFPMEKGLKLIELLDYPKADLIIFLDIDPEISIKRKSMEKESLDFHEKDLDYLRRVRESYIKEMSRNILGKWIKIDGEKSKKEVHEEIIKSLKGHNILPGGIDIGTE